VRDEVEQRAAVAKYRFAAWVFLLGGIGEVKLVVALHAAILDGGDDFVGEGIPAHSGGHEVDAVEAPALRAQAMDEVTAQYAACGMADDVQAHFALILEVRRFLAGSGGHRRLTASEYRKSGKTCRHKIPPLIQELPLVLFSA